MLHKLKKSLFEILIKIDKNVSIYFEDVEVETLFDKKGDFTTNAALKFSKIFGKNPNQLADIILNGINLNNFEKVEIAGPGFINIKLSKSALVKNISLILKNNKTYGSYKSSKTFNIELY